jgi:serine/threonine-protein kinase
LRDESAPTKPSSVVRDLDPLLERVIMRCLEKDPALRPASALQVAAALPGGDPLAAALAAGETPSPQMVAAAGENTGLAPRAGLAALSALLLGTLLFIYMGVKEDGLETLRPSKPPEVLSHHAREILATIGYTERPADSAGQFGYNNWFLSYVSKSGSPVADWKQILLQRPEMLEFWYRQSQSKMIPLGWTGVLTPGVATSDEPPQTESGMITMWMDSEGHLQWLQAIPQEIQATPDAPGSPPSVGQAPAVDWNPLFSAAGLDPAKLHPTAPKWLSLAAFDTRAAWDGTWPQSDRPMHVEAAAWHGRPVFFSLTGPWSRPNRTPTEENNSPIGNILGLGLLLFTVVAAVWFATRNLERGRGDRSGAWRLASIAFMVQIVTFLLRAHFVASLDILLPIVMAVSTSLFVAGALWVLYLALEPYVRRNWPQTIISWTRLMAGRFRDPLVGRDIVLGVGIGISWILVFEIGLFVRMRSGAPPEFPASMYLMGIREAAGSWLSTLVISIAGTLEFFFTLVLLRVLVRNRWVAAALFVAIFTIPHLLDSNHVVTDGVVWATIYGIAAIGVVRFGLIVLGISSLMANVLLNLPYTLDFSNWYATQCVFIAMIFVAMGVWGVYTSLAGKGLWKDEIFD